MSVDLGAGRQLQINHYCVRHGCGHAGYRLRSWRLEGSNDGTHWVVLREHNPIAARTPLELLPPKGYAVQAWAVHGVRVAYRHFRLVQPELLGGANTNGNHVLCCSGMELYGQLQCRAK